MTDEVERKAQQDFGRQVNEITQKMTRPTLARMMREVETFAKKKGVEPLVLATSLISTLAEACAAQAAHHPVGPISHWRKVAQAAMDGSFAAAAKERGEEPVIPDRRFPAQPKPLALAPAPWSPPEEKPLEGVKHETPEEHEVRVLREETVAELIAQGKTPEEAETAVVNLEAKGGRPLRRVERRTVDEVPEPLTPEQEKQKRDECFVAPEFLATWRDEKGYPPTAPWDKVGTKPEGTTK